VRKFEAEVHDVVKSGSEVVFPVREFSASASPCRDCVRSALSCRHFLLYVPNIESVSSKDQMPPFLLRPYFASHRHFVWFKVPGF